MTTVPTPAEIEALSGKALVDTFNALTAIRTPDAKPVTKFETVAKGRARVHSLANVLRLSNGGSIVSGVPSAAAKKRLAEAKANPVTVPSVVDTTRITWPLVVQANGGVETEVNELHGKPARAEPIAELVETAREFKTRKTATGEPTLADVVRRLLRDPTAPAVESELLTLLPSQTNRPFKSAVFRYYAQHPPIKNLRLITWDVKRRAK